MTISLVISIICVALFLIFSAILCFLFLRKQRLLKRNHQIHCDIEKLNLPQTQSAEFKPPRRQKNRRQCDDEHLCATPASPRNVPVPFNSPAIRRGSESKQEFQPMNLDERTRKKKEKRRKRKEEIKRQRSLKEPARVKLEYFNSKVHVAPLDFSEKNYAKNYITESLFAGSIHRGYGENSKEEEETRPVMSGQNFTSWRELFDEKMKNEEK